MPDQNYNPIRSVNGRTIPCPTAYQWKLSDVSAADAGRTEDALMHKMMIAQKVHLELEWQNVSTAIASQVLKAFNSSQYLTVVYLDPMAGTYRTKTFYVGDRAVPAYNVAMDLWSNVSFNIIER